MGWKCRMVWRYSRSEKMIRLFRVFRHVGRVGDGVGFSEMVSLAVVPCLLRHEREMRGWCLTILGLRVHYQKDFGGKHS